MAKKGVCTSYWPHSSKPNQVRTKNRGYLQVISIDPGTVNFAFLIERRYPRMVKTMVLELWNLGTNTQENNRVFATLLSRFSKHTELIKETDIVVVERQLKVNYKATGIARSAIMLLHVLLKDTPRYPTIYEIPASLKGRILGFHKGTDHNLKKWAVRQAKQILTERQDDETIAIVERRKKRDDLSDVICQSEAFFIWKKIIIRPVKIRLVINRNELRSDSSQRL